MENIIHYLQYYIHCDYKERCLCTHGSRQIDEKWCLNYILLTFPRHLRLSETPE